MKARLGSQDQLRKRAMAVVAARAVPRNPIVARDAGAPRSGGAASIATTPKAATAWEPARIAMTVAAAMLSSDPARASSAGTRP